MSSSSPHRIIVAVAAVALALGASGCSVRQDVTLAADGSGEAALSIALHPIMIEYMNDLTIAMTGVEAEYAIFDLEQLATSFAERDGVELTSLSRPARGALDLTVAFADVNEVFAREAGSGVLTLERDGGAYLLTVRLDREAVRRFLEFAPEESMTTAQYLLPPEDGSVSHVEYRDELAWALEEYADRDAVERVLDEAMIEVRITPEGRILDQRGGRIGGESVVFTIPVLEVLTLGRERVYSVRFAP